MAKRRIAAAAAFACLAAASTPAFAAGVLTGLVPGPDPGFNIVFEFTNDAASTLDILSLKVDISTATPLELVWDGAPLSVSGTAGVPFFTGSNTGAFTFTFAGWNPGETFSFKGDPDTPDNGAYGATVLGLLGTTVTVGFSDGSSKVYAFVDDTAPDAGLTLGAVEAAIPEPSVWGLMIAGFGMAGAGLRRRRSAIA